MTVAAVPRTWDAAAYELIDIGDGRRLERVGGVLLDRPAPAAGGAVRSADARWEAADARFERSAKEDGRWLPAAPEPWSVCHGSLTLEARATPSGGIGVFPEQVGNWAWLAERVLERAPAANGRSPDVLNLFAHTGGASLAAAVAGGRVVHVDASRPAVSWARRNATLSGLAAAPIRWIVDDALAFARREARRGRTYDVIVLDPPSYGHAPNRARWQLADQLPALLEACGAVLAAHGALVLSAHTPGYDSDRLAQDVAYSLRPGARVGSALELEPVELVLQASSGARLPAGSAVRAFRTP